MKISKGIFLVTTVAVFFVFNGMIIQKEKLLKSGQTVLLELAPRDPRSLLQGDYMELNYKMWRSSLIGINTTEPRQGKLVLHLDDKQVAQFVRIHHGETLAAREFLLIYRQSNSRWRLGAESFFFQEGQAALYRGAKYGELKIAPSGESILVGLRDEKFRRLGPQNAPF